MGTVSALRRYPVKSMLGEDLAAVRVALVLPFARSDFG
jgi:uncharacterized protein YcbX